MKSNKKLFILCWLVLFIALMPTASHAYLDPATTTYLIQIVSALIISLSVTAGIFARRIYMFFVNIRVRLTAAIIKLFSKKKKSIRADLARTAPQKAQAQGAFIGKGQRLRFLLSDDRPFYKRLLLALLLSAALSFTFIIFGIYDLFIANASQFPYSFNDIALPILLYGLCAFALLTLGFSVFKGKLFDLICSLALGVLVAGYLQGNFMNIDLGELTGDLIAWHTLTVNAVINTAVWVIIIAAPLTIRYFSKKMWRFIVKAVPSLIIAVQLISLVTLMLSPIIAQEEKRDKYLSTQAIYEIGKQKNIVVLLLDRLDERFIQEIADKEPEFFNSLDGFTRFTNNITCHTRTWPAIANMFSGEEMLFNMPRSEYSQKAWQDKATMFDELHADGFKTNLYMEEGWAFDSLSDIDGIADNITAGKLGLKFGMTINNFLRLSVFRYAPHIVKPSFWTTTDEFTNVLMHDVHPSPYYMDSFLFFDNLKNERLSRSKNDKIFSYIHLNGPHAPFNMDEYGNKVEEGQASCNTQTKGSMRILYEYLEQLRALGRYKDSTIIITGDHGESLNDNESLAAPILTALFVKPAGSEGTPLEYNNAPVSSDNLRATILSAAGLNYSGYGPTYFDIDENSKTERMVYFRINPQVNGGSGRLEIFKITGDAHDFANWHKQSDLEIKPEFYTN